MNSSQLDHQGVIEMTDEVVPRVVAMHLQAFDGYMSARLGPIYIDALIRWFRNNEQAVSLVALNDGQPAGYVIGAPVGYTVAMNRDLLVRAVLAIMARPWLLFERRIRKMAVSRLRLLAGKQPPKGNVPELPEPTMSLVGIGVLPDTQGQGIGRQLVQAFESRARELGARSMRLSVYPNNFAARSLYERCGWKPSREPPTTDTSMFYSRNLVKNLE